ncbi:MAG: hypothetical protein E7318_04245 [Clostridiales bacterium]|nr:hypothetical protein [Clostridiales bacterium]
MRRLLTLLLVLMMTASIALASEPANPADPAMVAELLPNYTYIEGIDDGDELRLLMRNASNELVFVGGIHGEDGLWRFTESTPLPEGTILGVENFTHSIGLPGTKYYSCVNVSPYADGTWGVSLIMPDGTGLFTLGQHSIHGETHEVYGTFGDHPWSDITAIDWTTLPSSYEDAVARVNRDNWAVVNNPNREDRLHLRVSPEKDAASLGKYYNRTPVRIREYGKTWCSVTVCGVDGYMMTEYLAFGEEMDGLDYAGPWLTRKEHLSEVRLYESPRTASKYIMHELNWFCVLGVAGDYYHVWLPDTEEYGYVHMDDLWEGNG